jgi:hypothetical protein
MTLAAAMALVIGGDRFPTLAVLAIVALFVIVGLLNFRRPR